MAAAAADSSAMVTRILLTAAYTVLGYLVKRAGILQYDDGKVMMKFVVNVTLPALLFYTLTHSGPLFGPGAPLVFGTAIVASAAVMGGAYVMYRKRPSYERGLLLGCLTGVNLGTFAYPFLEAVWGADGLRLAALYDIPNGIIVFGVAAGIFAAEQRNTTKEARSKSGKHDDGGVYEGEWSVGGESKQGVGTYTYPSGAIYEGEWNNNVKDGVGVYKWPKGGSYAGEFKRGTFNGLGVRFMRSGAVKSGRFEEGTFVEALGMEATDAAASAATDASNAARKAAEATRVRETASQAVARVLAKIITFPPMVAILLALVATGGGSGAAAEAVAGTSPLPAAVTAVLAPLAAANRPLVLVTLGVLFQPVLPRLQMRSVVHFLATKYSLSLFAAAAAAAAVPPSLGVVRYALAAIVLMPVPSVCVQYAIAHDFDARLAGAFTNYSQVSSLVALCTLGLLSGCGVSSPGSPASWWVMPAGLAAAAAAVAALGFVADKALAPKKMVFKPRSAEVAEPGATFAIAKPDDDGGGGGGTGGKGPMVAGAAGGSAGVGTGQNGAAAAAAGVDPWHVCGVRRATWHARVAAVPRRATWHARVAAGGTSQGRAPAAIRPSPGRSSGAASRVIRASIAAHPAAVFA